MKQRIVSFVILTVISAVTTRFVSLRITRMIHGVTRVKLQATGDLP